jgi:hypothetical protein
MGLPWIRLDTQFPSNPKILELTSTGKWRAVVVWLSSLAYCGSHGSDGYLGENSLSFIHARKSDAVDLVKCGLWIEDIGGWCVNGWEEFQLSDEAAKARSDKARKAAMKRWHGEGGFDAQA